MNITIILRKSNQFPDDNNDNDDLGGIFIACISVHLSMRKEL